MKKIGKHYYHITWLFGLVVAVLFTVALHAEESPTFKIILVPDTQIYAMRHPDTFYIQMKWIADHADDIAFVLQQGDITNNNTEAQWNVAAFSFRLLDGKVPYVLAVGNHDYINREGTDISRNATLANQFFPYETYSKMKGFGGAFESGKLENTWFTFHAGGIDWLVLSLEFGPRNRVLDWAAQIVKNYPKHKIIVNTHAYMDNNDIRMKPGTNHHPQQHYSFGKMTGEDSVNDGEMMWEKFVSQYPNMMFVFSGHVIGKGVGRRVDKGKHGNDVYQILANYQMRPQGGEGYLRIMTLNIPNKTIDVKTYSPLLNKYLEEPDHQFLFENADFQIK